VCACASQSECRRYLDYRGYRGGRTIEIDQGRPQPMLGCPSYDCASCSCFHRGTSICGFPSGSGDCYQGKLFPAAALSPPCRLPSEAASRGLERRGVAAPRVRRRRPLLVPPSGPAADLWQARSGSLRVRRCGGCGVLFAQSEQDRHPAPALYFASGFPLPAGFDSPAGGGTNAGQALRGTRVAVVCPPPTRPSFTGGGGDLDGVQTFDALLQGWLWVWVLQWLWLWWPHCMWSWAWVCAVPVWLA